MAYYVTVAGQKKPQHEGTFQSCCKYLMKFEKNGVNLKANYEIRGRELLRDPDEVHAFFSSIPEDVSDLV